MERFQGARFRGIEFQACASGQTVEGALTVEVSSQTVRSGEAFSHCIGRGTRLSRDEAETLVFVLASNDDCTIDLIGRSFADGAMSFDRRCSNGTRRVSRLVEMGLLVRRRGSRNVWLTEAGRIAAALTLARDKGLRVAYFDDWPA